MKILQSKLKILTKYFHMFISVLQYDINTKTTGRRKYWLI
jgi:hypothetical protein